jgi:hypothetical protein
VPLVRTPAVAPGYRGLQAPRRTRTPAGTHLKKCSAGEGFLGTLGYPIRCSSPQIRGLGSRRQGECGSAGVSLVCPRREPTARHASPSRRARSPHGCWGELGRAGHVDGSQPLPNPGVVRSNRAEGSSHARHLARTRLAEGNDGWGGADRAACGSIRGALRSREPARRRESPRCQRQAAGSRRNTSVRRSRSAAPYESMELLALRRHGCPRTSCG